MNCKDEDLMKFIESSLSFQLRPVSDDDNVTTDTGKVRILYRAMGKSGSKHSYDGVIRWLLIFRKFKHGCFSKFVCVIVYSIY